MKIQSNYLAETEWLADNLDLNGGWNKWVGEGGAISTHIPTVSPREFAGHDTIRYGRPGHIQKSGCI